MTALVDSLPDDTASLKAMLIGERAAHAAETERLRQIIRELQRHRFGRRAENLPADQLELALEEIEQAEAADAAAATGKAGPAKPAAVRRRNLGHLPAHLPRIEQVIDIEDKACPCCQGPLHLVGEDVAERLDIVPAQFRVLVTRRPRYACRACQEGIVQAPARPG